MVQYENIKNLLQLLQAENYPQKHGVTILVNPWFK
jgi:hypothetical protein